MAIDISILVGDPLGASLDERVPSLCVVLTLDLGGPCSLLSLLVLPSRRAARLDFSGPGSCQSSVKRRALTSVQTWKEVSRPEEFKNRTISWSVMHVAHGS